MFLGTNGYISPSWFADKSQAPTWNYVSAQCVVDMRFFDVPQAIEAHLRQLVNTMEAQAPRGADQIHLPERRCLDGGGMEAQAPRGADQIPWDVDQMGQHYFVRAPVIVGFEAEIREMRPKFKLGQDERGDVFSDIMAGLKHGPAADLQAWMRHYNSERC